MNLAEDILYQSGIKNQKWGVRRFQNKDGTWTSEGKKRRRLMEGDVKRKVSSKKDNKRKDTSLMSDEELQKLISRMQLEKQYRDLYNNLNPQKQSKAKMIFAKMLTNAIEEFSNQAIKKAARTVFGNDEDKSGNDSGNGSKKKKKKK